MSLSPGLHWVLIFEPEVFAPEVSMAENSKPVKNMMMFLMERRYLDEGVGGDVKCERHGDGSDGDGDGPPLYINVNDEQDDDWRHLSRPHVRSMAVPLAGSRNSEEYWRNLVQCKCQSQFQTKIK